MMLQPFLKVEQFVALWWGHHGDANPGPPIVKLIINPLAQRNPQVWWWFTGGLSCAVLSSFSRFIQNVTVPCAEPGVVTSGPDRSPNVALWCLSRLALKAFKNKSTRPKKSSGPGVILEVWLQCSAVFLLPKMSQIDTFYQFKCEPLGTVYI